MNQQHTFWAMTSENIATMFSTDIHNGLSAKEARRRLDIYGYNRTPHNPKTFLNQERVTYLPFINGALIVLAIALEAYGAGVLLLASIGFYLGVRMILKQQTAQARAWAKQKHLSHTLVIRNGKREEILMEEIVPGDVVYLPRAAMAPAEGRIIEAVSPERERWDPTKGYTLFEVQITPLAPNTPQEFQTNMIEPGDVILSGHVTCIITNTKKNNNTSSISKTATEQIRVNGQTMIPMWAWIIMLIVNFGLGWYHQSLLLSMIFVGFLIVALDVQAALRFSLLRTTKYLADKEILVHNQDTFLRSSQMRILLTDKTGTLTAEYMQVKNLYVNGDIINVDDVQPSSDILSPFVRICRLNANNSGSTEMALVRWAYAQTQIMLDGIAPGRLCEYEFNYNLRRMTTINPATKSSYYVATKGSAEHVIPLCDTVWQNQTVMPFTKDIHNQIQHSIDTMTKQGLRIVAIAERWTDDSCILENRTYAETGLIFIGLLGLLNPPREYIAPSILQLSRIGIQTIIVTGDNPMTTYQIGHQVGIIQNTSSIEQVVIHGNEIPKNKSDNSWRKRLNSARAFARVTPEDKDLVLQLLMKNMGYVVGMIGDSSNDRRALIKSDVAFAPCYGRDAAKQVADILLPENPFEGIYYVVQAARSCIQLLNIYQIYLWGNLVGLVTLYGYNIFRSQINLPPVVPLIMWSVEVVFGIAFLLYTPIVVESVSTKKHSIQKHFWLYTLCQMLGVVIAYEWLLQVHNKMTVSIILLMLVFQYALMLWQIQSAKHLLPVPNKYLIVMIAIILLIAVFISGWLTISEALLAFIAASVSILPILLLKSLTYLD